MRIRLARESRLFLVAVEGRFTARGIGQFQNAVVEQIGTDVPHVVLDLSGVDFMDAAAVAALVRADERAREAGGTLVLAGPTPAVRILLEVVQLHDAFRVADSVAAARLILPVAA